MTTEATSLPRAGVETAVHRQKAAAATPAPSHFAGVLWFAGWLFTIGFLQLGWWKAILGLVLWPYFLGASLH